MAMDNPSYFSVPTSELYNRQSSNPFERRQSNMGAGKLSESFTSTHSAAGGRLSSVPTTLSLGEPSNLRMKNPEKRGNDFLQSPKSPSGSAYLVPNGGLSSPRGDIDSGKRSFRSLLRSLSANAACSNDAQSILLGEPRPSDIAPPNHSDPFSLRSNRRLTHSRNTSLRSCAELRAVEFQQALMKRRAREFGANEDVFHTMPLPGTGRRRHSIGAYLSRERKSSKNVIKVTSVPSEVPRVEAPRVGSPGAAVRGPPAGPRAAVTTTLHCQEPQPASAPDPAPSAAVSTGHRRRKQRNQSMKEMESIVVVSCRESPEAELWADYYTSCFNRIISQRARQHYKVLTVHIEDLSGAIEENTKMKQVSNAKLQLIIMCPRLLQHVEELPESHLEILNVFQLEKVLAMLLGVNDDSVSDIHKKAFPSYDQWQRTVVKEQDNTFIDNFLSKAVDIMNKKDCPPVEKASFSIIPKKIKPGQKRVIALLNEPITNKDSITVKVDKMGEILQIHSFKKRNPYTLQFDVPDSCLEVSMFVWIKIEKNGVPCGSCQIKCESRLRELDEILRASDNPLEFMCQTLGFKKTDKDQLDTWMLTAFQRNIPPHFSLLSAPLQGNLKVNTNSVEEYPTLLHFAARFGLERLCWQLLECPGGEAACATRNLRHLTPADLAHHHGFPQLATVLRGHMRLNEFSNIYYCLVNMKEESPEGSVQPGNQLKILNSEHTTESWAKFNNSKANITPINTPDSNRSDPFSEECLHNLEVKHSQNKFVKAPESPRVPTSPKQLTGEWLYENDMCQMTSSFTSQNSVQKAIEADYLIQPSNRKVEIVETPPPNRPKLIELNLNKRNNHSNLTSPVAEKHSPFQLPPEFFESKNNFNSSYTKNKHSASVSVSSKGSHDHISTPTGQDELAEIIYDFKNNIFSMSEAEKLVTDWRNRNETPQSLKEKQDQLNKMREDYDKLQRRIKNDMKRPTSFERILRFFSRGKPKNGKGGVTDIKINGQRPNSGLSIHSVSSSSSGRLSTASGGSLGDSGTQSDNEDAKMFAEINAVPKSPTTLGSEKFVLEDYLIPPPPRPFSSNSNSHQPIIHLPRKNDPLPSIPVCHSKQEYMLKSPHPMDTISEKDVPAPVQDAGSEGSLCSQQITTQIHYLANDVSEHHYMNMSPA